MTVIVTTSSLAFWVSPASAPSANSPITILSLTANPKPPLTRVTLVSAYPFDPSSAITTVNVAPAPEPLYVTAACSVETV